MASEGARQHQRFSVPTLLNIHVSLKGRTVKTFTFAHDEVTIGRDPEADIFLDNVGVSREHARFERTAAGFVIEDLSSANGTYLNDEPVQRHLVHDNDIVQIGKYSLRVGEREERRADEPEHHSHGSGSLEQTTVLTRDQVAKVLTSSRTGEESASPTRPSRGETPAAAPAAAATPGRRTWTLVFGVFGACLAGGALGAVAAYFLLR